MSDLLAMSDLSHKEYGLGIAEGILRQLQEIVTPRRGATSQDILTEVRGWIEEGMADAIKMRAEVKAQLEKMAVASTANPRPGVIRRIPEGKEFTTAGDIRDVMVDFKTPPEYETGSPEKGQS